MALIATDKAGSDIEPIAPGMHQGVCYAVIDIGTQPQFGNFPSRRKIIILWELPQNRMEFTKDGVTKNLPRTINAKYTLSLASKGNLRPTLESWRGRPFTADELYGFDVSKLIGVNCLINVVHANGTGKNATKVYANVSSVNPLMKGMQQFKPENHTMVFSMDDFPGAVKIPDHMPEWIKKLIEQSDEYLTKAQGAPPPAQRAGNPPGPDGQAFPPNNGADEQDIPF